MKLLRPLLILALLFSAASCRRADAAVQARTSAYHAAPIGGPTKVWCIGDSFMRNAVPINGGASYSYTAPMRTVMFAAMTAAGAAPNFVGTQLNASESPPVTTAGTGHDGLNGSSAAQWRDSFFALKVAQFATPDDMPHIVFVILGNNDGDEAATGTAIAAVVDLIFASAPRASVFVSTVLPSPGLPRLLTNAQLRIEIASRVARGYHVQLVEMQQLTVASISIVDMPDGQHPSTGLYRQMGGVFSFLVEPLLR